MSNKHKISVMTSENKNLRKTKMWCPICEVV